MELVTAPLCSPGSGERTAHPDQVLIAPRLGLLGVAEAPGGGDCGRAGARLALEVVRGHVERNEDVLQRFRRNPTPELRQRILTLLDEAFTRAAQEMFAFARRREGVLVTLDVAILLGSEVFVGHVGDGRVYLVRRGLVHQLTVDHARDPSVAFEVEPVPTDPHRTRALGPQSHVRVESTCMELATEDRLVLASSTLARAIPENILHTRLISEHLEALGPALARDAGGSPLLGAFAQLGSGEPFAPDPARARLAILAPMPLFAHCNDRELRAVALATRPSRFPEGAVIFEQGSPGTALYLVISGAVEIIRDGRTIATLGPGSNFGEMAMLDEPNRSATAVSTADTELMVIPRDAFFALLHGNPMLATKILWNLTLRLSSNLRVTSERLAELERLTRRS